MQRRVVVTGMGVITSIGEDVPTFFDNIKAGTCGISVNDAFDTSEYKVKLAAQVKTFDATKTIDARSAKRMDRHQQFAVAAAKQAYEDAQLTDFEMDRTRIGVIVSSGIGGIDTMEASILKLNERGPNRVSPFFIPMSIMNLAAGHVAIELNAQGVCSCTVTACAGGTSAIGEAYRAIKDGYLDVMVAGGTEASITPISVSGFQAMKALNESENPIRASIPFDAERSGFVMGEGAGVLILEELEQARLRGAKIYGEIVGYGASCDAFHMTAPCEDGRGGAQAMTQALESAGLAAHEIDYINAHGTSTPMNDKTETAAIKKAFGAQAYKIPVSSTKSMTGHLLGASGAVEGIIILKAVQEGFIPATINYQVADEACDLDIVPNIGRTQPLTYAMSNSLGFGGHNASIIVKKWSEENVK